MAITLRKDEANRGSGTIFLNVNLKSGSFTTRVEDENGNRVKHTYEPGEAAASGLLSNIKIQEREYEGKTSHEMSLTLTDMDPSVPRTVVTLRSAYNGEPTMEGLKIIGTLLNTDLTREISMRPWFIEAGTKFGDGTVTERDQSGVSMKQGDTKLMPVYLKPEGDTLVRLDRLPKMPLQTNAKGEPIMVAGQPLKDKSEWQAIYGATLTALSEKHEQLKPQIMEIIKSGLNTEGHEDSAGAHDIDLDDEADVAAAAEAAAARPRP